MTPVQRRIATLLVSFPKDLYTAMEVWFTCRPQITPLHVRDTLAAGDGNYVPFEGDVDRASVEADLEVELSIGERFVSASPTSRNGK